MENASYWNHVCVSNCKTSQLLDENYFHTALEAIKGVVERIRTLSGIDSDGAGLVNRAFSVNNPILAINSLQSKT